jgi:hypothetical protein
MLVLMADDPSVWISLADLTANLDGQAAARLALSTLDSTRIGPRGGTSRRTKASAHVSHWDSFSRIKKTAIHRRAIHRREVKRSFHHFLIFIEVKKINFQQIPLSS